METYFVSENIIYKQFKVPSTVNFNIIKSSTKRNKLFQYPKINNFKIWSKSKGTIHMGNLKLCIFDDTFNKDQ